MSTSQSVNSQNVNSQITKFTKNAYVAELVCREEGWVLEVIKLLACLWSSYMAFAKYCTYIVYLERITEFETLCSAKLPLRAGVILASQTYRIFMCLYNEANP